MKTKVLLDKKAIERTVNRMTHEILEKNEGSSALSLIGIRTSGIYLANRIQDKDKGYRRHNASLGGPGHYPVPG